MDNENEAVETQENSTEQETKTFIQEEVDSIVNNRLSCQEIQQEQIVIPNRSPSIIFLFFFCHVTMYGKEVKLILSYLNYFRRILIISLIAFISSVAGTAQAPNIAYLAIFSEVSRFFFLFFFAKHLTT